MENKTYRIKITGCEGADNIWYSNKIGNVYDAILETKPELRFRISSFMYVRFFHGEIIAEQKHEFKKKEIKVVKARELRKVNDTIIYEALEMLHKGGDRYLMAKKLGISVSTLCRIGKNKKSNGEKYYDEAA